ncbi:MAG: hypothetical protein KA059_01820 [Elusimicrobiales bacterium]|nr:hypothetical protein [Elusimicrobiales bacterium]
MIEMIEENILFIMFSAVALLFLLFIVYFIDSARRNKKRKKEIINIAQQNSFEYDPDGSIIISYMNYLPSPETQKKNIFTLLLFEGWVPKDSPQSDALSSTQIKHFIIGHSKKIKNMISVPFHNKKIFFFDYYYTIGRGKNSHKYSQTVALFKSDITLPEFTMRPENFLDSISEFVGFNDIDISGFEKFSKIYYLKGSDENAVLSFFSPERAAIFEENPGYYVEASNRYIIFHKNKLIPVKDYRDYINSIIAILSGLKLDAN